MRLQTKEEIGAHFISYDAMRWLGRGTAFPTAGDGVALTAGDRFLRTDFTPPRVYFYTGSAWALMLGRVAARAYNSANISVANGTVTSLNLNSERFDSDDFHSTSSNTSRLTIPSGLGGFYTISASIAWATNSTGERMLGILHNGTTYIARAQQATGSTNDLRQNVSTIYNLTAGDYVEISVWQNSGGALNVLSVGNDSPELSIIRVG